MLKIKKSFVSIVLLFVSLTILPSLSVLSSTGFGKSAVEDFFKRASKIQDYFIDEKLKKELSLSNDQVNAMKAILKQSNADRVAVFERRIELVDQIELNNLRGEELSKVLGELDALDDRFLELEKSRRSQLRDTLSDEQKAKFTILRRQAVRKIFNIIKPLL